MKKKVPLDQGESVSLRVNSDTTVYPITLVDKHEASRILGISPETLKKYRRQGNSTLIEGIHYHVWNSRVIRYNAKLLADWGVNRHNPQAHQRAIEMYLAALPSNQPSKRGRKAS